MTTICIELVTFKYGMGRRDSTVCKAPDSHVADPGSISRMPYSPLSLPGVKYEHRAGVTLSTGMYGPKMKSKKQTKKIGTDQR